MSNFGQLKERYGVTPKEPVLLPNTLTACDQCETQTPTKILFMKAGLGNACSDCGRLRRGKPYISKPEFKALMLKMAKGGINETEAV